MGTLLKFLLIAVLGYWLLKAIKRMFRPGIQGQPGQQGRQGRAQDRFYSNNQRTNSNYQQQQRPEGHVRIMKKRSDDDENHVSGGEYVDFEEVD